MWSIDHADKLTLTSPRAPYFRQKSDKRVLMHMSVWKQKTQHIYNMSIVGVMGQPRKKTSDLVKIIENPDRTQINLVRTILQY